MTPNKDPETLTDLLRTLERSSDLRALARECGLSVRELRRRLSIWRRELRDEQEVQEDPAAKAKASGMRKRTKADPAAADRWPELADAAEIEENPLPEPDVDILEIYTDGASRGNPGPASIGVVFKVKHGPDLCSYREAIGKATNNVAEYQAVVAALEHCRRWGVKRVHLHMDSELIVRQLNGVYRVKSPDLRPLYQQAVFLSRDLRDFKVKHVPRAQNAHADHLANRALDE